MVHLLVMDDGLDCHSHVLESLFLDHRHCLALEYLQRSHHQPQVVECDGRDLHRLNLRLIPILLIRANVHIKANTGS